jgi:hypothetical protein
VSRYHDVNGYFELSKKEVKLDLEQELDSQEQIRRLEKSKAGIDLYKLPKGTRPCISQLLITPIEEGNGRSKSGLFIAVELRRCDIPENKIEKILRHWNSSNIPPLKDKEIRGILKQSSKKNTKGSYMYSPGCNNHLLNYCIGKDLCNYYIRNFKGKGSIEPNYLSKGWQYVLTAREHLLLRKLKDIETARNLSAGSPIVITVKQLNYHTGINTRYFREILTSLSNYGLVTYIPGSPQVWEHKATEIRRVIPAPEIPKRYREEENYKEYKKVMKERLKTKEETSDALANLKKT